MKKTLLASGALLAYTFVGYPALVGILARVRPRRLSALGAARPRVSVVVAAHNESRVLGMKLANLEALAYPDALEVIVVTDGSEDGTQDVAGRFPGVTVLHRPERRGKASALNRGAEAATGDVIIFSDANNVLVEGTVEALVAPFAEPAVGVVTGRKAISDEQGRPLDRAEGLYWRYEAKIKEWESRVASVTGVSGEILAVRREALRPLPEDALVEDFELALRAAQEGWRVTYAPEAVSVEPASATVEDEATRRTRIAVGVYQALSRGLPGLLRHNPVFALQVVSHKGLRLLVPFALVAAAAGTVASLPRSRSARTLAAVQAAFYLAAVVGRRRARRGGRGLFFFTPYYFCRMNVVAARGLRDFITGRTSVLWERVERAGPDQPTASR